jgi:hypothetical protein
MKFSKENRKYLTKELQSNISNVVKIEIAELFKSERNEISYFCEHCDSILAFRRCNFCGEFNDFDINEMEKRNFVN